MTASLIVAALIAFAVMSAWPLSAVAILLRKDIGDGKVEIHLTTTIVRHSKIDAERIAADHAKRENPDREVVVVTAVQINLFARYKLLDTLPKSVVSWIKDLS
ncbi:hypothetical protein LCGC14_2526490, partial [marine sediment metagenome]